MNFLLTFDELIFIAAILVLGQGMLLIEFGLPRLLFIVQSV